MRIMKLTLFLVIGLMISNLNAGNPQNFTIKYVYKNPDGSVFSIRKYYLSDGNKYRSEYYSTMQYNISGSAEAQVDNNKVESKAEAKMEAEKISDPEPHTIEILRSDKKLVWTMSPDFKQYSEVPLRPDSWEHALEGFFYSDTLKATKIGEEKILEYQCDKYEYVQKHNEDTWTNIFCVAKGLNIILKSEMLQNGKLVQLQETTEFSTDKQNPMLFEVPDGYQKNDNN